jgi:hypothetical protein
MYIDIESVMNIKYWCFFEVVVAGIDWTLNYFFRERGREVEG